MQFGYLQFGGLNPKADLGISTEESSATDMHRWISHGCMPGFADAKQSKLALSQGAPMTGPARGALLTGLAWDGREEDQMLQAGNVTSTGVANLQVDCPSYHLGVRRCDLWVVCGIQCRECTKWWCWDVGTRICSADQYVTCRDSPWLQSSWRDGPQQALC